MTVRVVDDAQPVPLLTTLEHIRSGSLNLSGLCGGDNSLCKHESRIAGLQNPHAGLFDDKGMPKVSSNRFKRTTDLSLATRDHSGLYNKNCIVRVDVDQRIKILAHDCGVSTLDQQFNRMLLHLPAFRLCLTCLRLTCKTRPVPRLGRA